MTHNTRPAASRPAGKVRCQDCGFLANQHFETGDRFPVDENSRRSGRLRTLAGANHGPMAVCFVAAADLMADCTGDQFSNDASEAIHRERECPSFMPWRPGLTPKEHLQMQLAQEERDWRVEQERKNQDREEARQRRDQEYRDKRDHEEAEWRASQERHSGRQLWIAGVLTALIVALILAAAQVFCTWWQISDARAGRSQPPVPAVKP